jgi:alpha-galactosidase
MGDVWKWGGDVGGNLWRTTGDINDSWGSMAGIGFSQFDKSSYAKPGNWNDPDMLVVGRLGWGNVRPTNLTPDEQYTHISLWSLLAAPMLIGCDLEHIDAFTKNLLCNAEVIDINQDPLGRQAEKVSDKNDLLICKKMLSDGSIAVGMFNRSEKYMKNVSLQWDGLSISGKYAVRDVWRQKELGKSADKWSANIPAHGAVLLRLTEVK